LAKLSPGGGLRDAHELLHIPDVGDPTEVDVRYPPLAVNSMPARSQPISVTVEPCTYQAVDVSLINRPLRFEPEKLVVSLLDKGRKLKTNSSILVARSGDLDQDGLDQAWENLALELVNPYIEVDEEEQWLKERDRDPVVNFVRVAPYPSYDDPQYIIFSYAVSWSMDYGGVGAGNAYSAAEDHRGDVERVSQAWRVLDERTLKLEWVTTSSHGGVTNHSGVWHVADRTCNPGGMSNVPSQFIDLIPTDSGTQMMCGNLEFASDGRLVIQASEDKHAMYPTVGICEDVVTVRPGYGEDCGWDPLTVGGQTVPGQWKESDFKADKRYGGHGRWLFDCYNAGEPAFHLIDSLDAPPSWKGLTELQRTNLTGKFPREAVWSGNQSDREKFCGGKLETSFSAGVTNVFPEKCCPYIGVRLESPADELVYKLQSRYRVTVKTGDVTGAGTDAVAGIRIFGSQGDTNGVLWASLERGDTDIVHLGANDVGEVQSIELLHDDSGGIGSGWYVKEVRVYDKFRKKEWVFAANRWLAKDEADGKLHATFYPSVP
jgi:hypothetical protein